MVSGDTLVASPGTAGQRPRRSARLGLRLRLLALILLAAVPVLVIQVQDNLAQRERRLAQIAADAEQFALLVAAQQNRFVEGARYLLTAFAQMPEVVEGDPEGCHARASALRSRFPELNGLGAYRLDGSQLCTSRSNAPAVSLIDRPYIQKALHDGQFSSSGYIVGRATGQPSFNFAYPVRAEDRTIRGGVLAAFSLDTLSKMLAETAFPRDVSVTLFDGAGIVVARIPEPERWVGQSILGTALEPMLAMQRGTLEGTGLDGTGRIFGVAVLDQPANLWVAVGMPRDALLVVIDRLFWQRLLLVVAAFVLAAAVALIGGEIAIRRPVLRLRKAVDAVERGEWPEATPLSAGGTPEIAGLAERFRVMARSLQARDAELTALNQTLEQRVADRTVELRAANQRLEQEIRERENVEAALRQSQKMEAVGNLTGGIAHDFNNMLTGVIGNLDLLQRRLTGREGTRYADAAMQSAVRASAMTQRLLAFSRRQPLAPQSVDVNRLVAGMADMIARSVGESIRVETVLMGGLWRTWCDPNQLESTLLNLVVNARDAMPDGGRLTIETANAHLDEVYADSHGEVVPGQYVLLSVTDNGTGMPADVVQKAFDPFFTTKPTGVGTGLGLSMVYGYVKQSGGHVKIYSEPRQGTTVKIYLRRQLAAEVEEVPAPRREPAIDGAGRGVLIVEDEALVRQVAVDSLLEAGYVVHEAADGPQAIAILESGVAVDLMVTDVGLPGMNGRQLAELVRQRRPEAQVLYTTGYARNAIVHNGTLDHGVELLTKPFTVDALVAKVGQMLAG